MDTEELRLVRLEFIDTQYNVIPYPQFCGPCLATSDFTQELSFLTLLAVFQEVQPIDALELVERSQLSLPTQCSHHEWTATNFSSNNALGPFNNR